MINKTIHFLFFNSFLFYICWAKTVIHKKIQQEFSYKFGTKIPCVFLLLCRNSVIDVMYPNNKLNWQKKMIFFFIWSGSSPINLVRIGSWTLHLFYIQTAINWRFPFWAKASKPNHVTKGLFTHWSGIIEVLVGSSRHAVHFVKPYILLTNS